jgi:YVTN family beta-propeller protein
MTLRGLLTVSAAMLAGAACASSTGPGHLTHPTGLVYASPVVTGQPYGVAISNDGIVLVARVDAGLVSRFDLPDTTPTTSLPAGLQPVHVAINSAGTRAYVVNQGGQALRWLTVSPFGSLDSLPLTNDGFNLAVAPDGQHIYVTTADGRVYVVHAVTGTIVDSMRVGGAANGLAFSPTGSRLYVSSRDAGTVTVFDTRTDLPLDTIVTGGAPQRLAVTPDGLTLFAANETAGVNVVTLATGALQIIPLDGSAYGLGLTPDGSQLYATDPTTGTIFIVNVATHAVVDSLPVGGTPRNVAFDHDGTTAVVTDGAGRVIFIR